MMDIAMLQNALRERCLQQVITDKDAVRRVRALLWARLPRHLRQPKVDRGNKRPPSSDLELLRQLRAGDGEALTNLYDRYAPRLLRYGEREVGLADAEELVLDTFYRFQKYEGDIYDVEGYLFRVLRTKIIDLHRKRMRQSEVPLDETLTDSTPDAVRVLLAKRKLETVLEFLLTLPELKRSLVVLAMNGHTGPEIASELGISVANVRVILCRVRKMLNGGDA